MSAVIQFESLWCKNHDLEKPFKVVLADERTGGVTYLVDGDIYRAFLERTSRII